MIAVAARREGAVKYLLQQGADPRLGDSAALWVAAYAGDIPIIRLLLAHGADKNSFRQGFGTPRNAALAAQHPEAAEILE